MISSQMGSLQLQSIGTREYQAIKILDSRQVASQQNLEIRNVLPKEFGSFELAEAGKGVQFLLL